MILSTLGLDSDDFKIYYWYIRSAYLSLVCFILSWDVIRMCRQNLKDKFYIVVLRPIMLYIAKYRLVKNSLVHEMKVVERECLNGCVTY